MSMEQEIRSWTFPASIEASPVPSVGDKAPSVTGKLEFPRKDGKGVVICFLRHCGCPFAERTYVDLRTLALSNPSNHYIALSHSSPSSTTKWLASINEAHPLSPSPSTTTSTTTDPIETVVDEDREIYAKWGLGIGGLWHVLNPSSLFSVWKLGKEKGIWNRPTESGYRWQTGGSFAVDSGGSVVWVGVEGRAGEEVDFEEAVGKLGGKS